MFFQTVTSIFTVTSVVKDTYTVKEVFSHFPHFFWKSLSVYLEHQSWSFMNRTPLKATWTLTGGFCLPSFPPSFFSGSWTAEQAGGHTLRLRCDLLGCMLHHFAGRYPSIYRDDMVNLIFSLLDNRRSSITWPILPFWNAPYFTTP